MCGRFRNPRDLSKLAARYGIQTLVNFPFDPNVAPTEETPIFFKNFDGLKVQLARFGLLAPNADTLKSAYSTFNARADTLLTKPFWKQPYSQGRFCIIPAEGFYEWREENGLKQPYYFSRKDGELMEFAGLWNYSEIDKHKIYSFTIITTEANAVVKDYHDRMPVVLENGQKWLQIGDMNFLKPFDTSKTVVRSVSRLMNKPQMKNLIAIDALSQ